VLTLSRCSHRALLCADSQPLLDLFLPNELEACAIARVPAGAVDDALAKLCAQCAGRVVITRGAHGALIGGLGMVPRSVSAPPVAAIDAVGAGDAFKAGLLACFVAGAPLHEAAQYGCVTGAMCVTMRGACSDPPDASHVAAFAAAHGYDLRPPVSLKQLVLETDSELRRGSVGGAAGGAPTEDHLLWWAFALLWLGGTWPYQSTLQAQAYYATELPDLDFLILITFTWPLLGSHLLQVFTGAAKAAGFSRRIFAAFGLNALVGVAFLVQDVLPLNLDGRRAIIMTLAALVALAQVLLEPDPPSDPLGPPRTPSDPPPSLDVTRGRSSSSLLSLASPPRSPAVPPPRR
jgi:hypothetical protein